MRKESRRRQIAVILCFTLVVMLFSACGKSKEEQGKQPTPAVTAGATVTPVPTATPVPAMGAGTSLWNPDNGFVFNGDGYHSGYVSETLPEGFERVTITADDPAGSKQNNASLAVDSSFILTTKAAVSEQEVKENLKLMAVSADYEITYSLETVSETSYRITPDTGLQENAVYRFVIGDNENPYGSFVFQTESELVVKSMYPADTEIHIPTNTGIEITLSEAVSSDCVIQDYFTIEPAVAGDYRMYPDGKTIVFIPTQTLAPNTVYTVSAKEGLAGVSGKVLQETVTAKFRTAGTVDEDDISFEIYISDRDITVTEGKTANLFFYGWSNRGNDINMDDAVVTVYRYRDAQACVDAMMEFQTVKADYIYSSEGYRYPTEGLVKVDSYTCPLEKPEWSYLEIDIPLPLLEEGAYLLEVELSGEVSGKSFQVSEQAHLQVSDLILYTESYDGNLLFWLNDAESGVISGAELSVSAFSYRDVWNLESGESSFHKTVLTTNGDGVAQLDLGDDNAAFVLVTDGERSAYACVTGDMHRDAAEYYSFIYTDRSTYFCDDTVNYFGMLAPAEDGMALPETIYLKTPGNINPIPVEVDENGCFEGSVEIGNSFYWYFYLQFTDADGNYIGSTGISVTREEKPVYTVSAEFDRAYYRIGDTITATVTASFFDGTPAPGLSFDLELSVDNERYMESVYTGEDGSARISFTPDSSRMYSYSTHPLTVYLSGCLNGDDLSSVWLSESAYYFNSNMIFEVDRILPEDGGQSYTEVTLRYRDFDALRSGADLRYPAFPKNSYGAFADGTVTVELKKIEYIERQTGTEYDPVSKLSYPVYEYSVRETTVESCERELTDGVLQLPHMSGEDFKGYYMYKISYTDPDTGNVYTEESYAVLGSNAYYNPDMGRYYHMEVTEGPYGLNREIACNLYYGSETVQDRPVLFTLYSDSGMSYYYSPDGSYDFEFTKELAPAAMLCATMQYGGNLEYLCRMPLTYDFENNNLLEVEVLTDAYEYAPQDTVNVQIRVSGLKDGGQPAFAVLSVVDEACFALGEQHIYPEEYAGYDHIYVSRNGRFSSFADTQYGYYGDKESDFAEDSAVSEEATNGMVSGSGQQDVNIRELFLNNPLFTVVELDENGCAEIEFAVPDNITEWRLTALACQPSVEGGAASVVDAGLGYTASDIICTLPFFLNAEVNEIFLEGDDIVVSARTYGSEVTYGTPVEYFAELYDEDGTLLGEVSVDGNAFEAAWLNFHKQPLGSYELVVKAYAAGEDAAAYSDGIRLKFDVVESGSVMWIEKDLKPEELDGISPMLYPVRLSFYDAVYEPYVEAVRKLLYSYNNRNDSLAAYYAAAAAAERLFGSSNRSSELDEIRQKFSESYGFLPVLEYGEGDVEFSAKVCALVPEALSGSKKAELMGLFESVTTAETITDPEELCAALFGLAALGCPVLDELYFATANSNGFSVSAMLYLTAAYAYIGDFASAYELYQALAAEYRVEKGGEIYFEGSTTEESIRLSAYALLSAALICKTDAEGLYRYLNTHSSTVSLYQLEQAAYVKYFYPMEAEPEAFTWKIGETCEEISLNPGEVYTLNLSRRDLEALELEAYGENLRVRAQYFGGVEEALDEVWENGTGQPEASKELKIEKSILPYDEDRNLYLVTLSYEITTDRNYSCYTISDYIPSGARWYPYDNTYHWDNSGDWYVSGYVSQLSGQSVSGNIYVYRADTDKLAGLDEVTLYGNISYLIRAAAEGEFVIDKAVLQDRAGTSAALSLGGTVVIADEGWTLTAE